MGSEMCIRDRTCKADYGSDGESCHTRTWDVTYLAVPIEDGWIYAEFEDLGLGVQECMLGSCDMLGILRNEGVFVVFDLR